MRDTIQKSTAAQTVGLRSLASPVNLRVLNNAFSYVLFFKYMKDFLNIYKGEAESEYKLVIAEKARKVRN